jgi:hypothetical protein
VLLSAIAARADIFEKLFGRQVRWNYRFLNQVGFRIGSEEAYVKSLRIWYFMGGIILVAFGVGTAVAVIRN